MPMVGVHVLHPMSVNPVDDAECGLEDCETDARLLEKSTAAGR